MIILETHRLIFRHLELADLDSHLRCPGAIVLK